MNRLLGYDNEYLKKIGGYTTAKEIGNQPRLWMETLEIVRDKKSCIEGFLSKAFNHEDLRIIFTGAGSSAFVGQSVIPFLDKKLKYKVEDIATTDIVSHPDHFLDSEIPTIIISCARSGNSPESVAAIKLAKDIVDNLYHIVLTCNPDGELAKMAKEDDNDMTILMPEDSNDQGFAMTGSFTSMVLASILLFSLDEIDGLTPQVERVADAGERILNEAPKALIDIAKLDYDRTVYLGAACLYGLARESALKLLELSAGKVATSYDSCLGFRHGPKSIMNEKTLLIVYLASDSYAREYELDLLREIHEQNSETKVIVISDYSDDKLRDVSDYCFCINSEEEYYSDDCMLLFDYILYAQIIALQKSIELGISPDNPCPDGSVNRVVKGVIIHPHNKNQTVS